MSDKNNNKSWRIGEDGTGRTVLIWDTGSERVQQKRDEERDPLAQTYDLLQALDVPDLAIEGEDEDDGSRNPYDTGV